MAYLIYTKKNMSEDRLGYTKYLKIKKVLKHSIMQKKFNHFLDCVEIISVNYIH